MEEQTPTCSGFLLKRGDGIIGVMSRKWFELVGNKLYFYKTNIPGKKVLPMGTIHLDDCTVDTESDVSKLKIVIKSKDKSHEMQAETVSSFERWSNELSKAKTLKPTTAPTKPMISPRNNVRKKIVLNSASPKPVTSAAVSLDDFDTLKTLGRGQYGKVIKVRRKADGEIFAMKIIDKSIVLSDDIVESTNNEQLILKTIKHPFIVALHYAFQTREKLCLILDFLTGGELFYHLQKEELFGVNKVRFYIGEIFLAIEYLHTKNIIYRDLKPENIVLDGKGHAVITDFGLSKTNIDKQQAFTFCGTPEYLAPEIIAGRGHGREVDYWSLGVMTFTLMCGYPPFSHENVMMLYQTIMSNADPDFPEEIVLEPKYEDALSFTMGLLERDPAKRLNSKGVRTHPFFAKMGPNWWDDLYNKKIKPPFVPVATADYVDEVFSSEAATDDIFKEKIINQDEHFKDYDYDADWS
ncbi:serine/threonine-protein kinase RAC [Acrasis kona]|uniref:Serine/threonine-protein kinase RAC n=1 Tax=Acrasis kona TaxID=1008807 RepID=A0AAW2YVS8_9EUKA